MTTKITVTEHYVDPAGKPLHGTVTFTPSVRYIDVDGQTTVAVHPVTAKLNVNGYLSVQLTATTGPGISPSGWVWAVQEHLTGGESAAAYSIALPYDGPSAVTLRSMSPVPDFTPLVLAPIVDEFVNVMDHGCVGDGTTDDTASFEVARAAAQTFGRPLFLPPGLTFKVSEIVPLWNGARVLAYGATLDIQTDHSATGRYLGLTNLEDVEVRGLRLKQSNGSGRNGVYGMVSIFGGGDILIEDLMVNGGESTGIWTGTPGVAVASGVSALRIVRPKILNTYADGIHLSRGATDVQIDSPLVIGAGDDGIGIVSIVTDDGTHNYNQLKRVTISNPIVRNLAILGSGVSIVGAKDVAVVGGISDTVHASGIKVAQGASGNGSATPAASDVDIAGHHVRNAVGSGFAISNASDCTVTGGSSKGSTAADGIDFIAATNCTATGVKLTGNVGFGVYETGSSTGCHVLSCDLRGNTAGASHFDDAGNSADASCITA